MKGGGISSVSWVGRARGGDGAWEEEPGYASTFLTMSRESHDVNAVFSQERRRMKHERAKKLAKCHRIALAARNTHHHSQKRDKNWKAVSDALDAVDSLLREIANSNEMAKDFKNRRNRRDTSFLFSLFSSDPKRRLTTEQCIDISVKLPEAGVKTVKDVRELRHNTPLVHFIVKSLKCEPVDVQTFQRVCRVVTGGKKSPRRSRPDQAQRGTPPHASETLVVRTKSGQVFNLLSLVE